MKQAVSLPNSEISLTDAERAVLDYLAGGVETDRWGRPVEYWAQGFAGIAAATDLSVPDVRAACRRLRDLGLVQYHRAIWSEDGALMGAGYSVTEMGVRVAREGRR